MEYKNNILYVDDEIQNLIAFKAAFRRHFNIFTASSAAEGLEIFNNNSIQVVLTDQRMPLITGVQFLQEIIPKNPHCIRMVLTGYSDIEAIIQAINSGQVFRYITKPWDDNELKMTIDGALRVYHTEENNRNLIEQLKKKTIEQEEIIEERTHEIVKKNQFLEIKNVEIARKNKEITDSINYAKRIQIAILPPVSLLRQQFPNSFILYKPKDIVAGDFYWMEEKDDIIFIAAADCTGHGVPGAMVSVVCSNALNRAVKEFGLRVPGKILDKVTDLVLETFEKSSSDVKDGMDISLLAFNKTTKQIQWSGAANPLWYIDSGSFKEIDADKQPIGKNDNRVPFTTHDIVFSPNSTFYLFTDGYPDQFGGPKGKKFKYKKLEEILISNSNLSMRDQENILEQEFHNWKGDLEQVDDVTIIGIRV